MGSGISAQVGLERLRLRIAACMLDRVELMTSRLLQSCALSRDVDTLGIKSIDDCALRPYVVRTEGTLKKDTR